MKKLLIDLGSTNIKWKISGQEEVFSCPFPQALVDDGIKYEVNAEEIYKLIVNIIDSTHPNSVYFSVQMHGYVLFNKGEKVTNYISWRDTRGKDIIPPFNIDYSYGVNNKPNLPRKSVLSQNIAFDEFMTLGSYIVYMLTGINQSHVTDIAPTGFLNLNKKKYDEVGFHLPAVSYEVVCVGKYNGATIYTPVGDQQASILGVNSIYKEDTYYLNVGTASQICLLNKDMINLPILESRPYFNDIYLITVTNLPGGRMLINYDDEYLYNYLFPIYKEVLQNLPKRDKIIATGGAVIKRKELFTRLFNALNVPFILNDLGDALIGLEALAKGDC